MEHGEQSDPVPPEQQPRRINVNPMELLLGVLVANSGDEKWYKAERISRKALQERYPDANRFRKTDGNIAAVDFGTTFCSLAFVTDIETPSDAATGHSNVTGDGVAVSTIRLNEVFARVPTAILLKESSAAISSRDDSIQGISRTCDYDIAAFGYEATNMQCRPRQRAKYLYFERFKMDLQHDEGVHRNMTIKSSDGREFYLVEVIAFVLKYLKNCLDKHFSGVLTSADFDWVITVPAIWKARGKRMMREAAYMAGLTSADPGISCFLNIGKGIPCPKETNPDKLTLALEPEAAAIYCQAQRSNDHWLIQMLQQPKQYIVIDIGGGTVDITVHSHNQKGIKVLTPPVGNNCGGTMVNRQFSKFLQESIESNDMSELSFLKESPERMAIFNRFLYETFENQKVAFGDRYVYSEPLEGDMLPVQLPTKFVEFYGIDKIKAKIAALKDEKIDMEDDTILIAPSKFAEFFEPAIKGILECIEEVFTQLEEKVNTVFLVGGFGGCKYTYESISAMLKTKFPERQLDVFVPKDHKLAVAQGAVQYRLKPDMICSRVMDASYGTDIVPLFNPLLHDHRYGGLDHTGTPRVKDVYLRYVEKGEQISSDQVVTGEFFPGNNSATEMKICIYSSFEKGVKYISTPDGNPNPLVRMVGELRVDIPNPDNLPREKRRVELTMDFSHTEIQVRARYIVTGEEVKVVADFLSSQVDLVKSSNCD